MNHPKKPPCILIIDDEPQFRRLFIKMLAHLPYEVIDAEDGKQGLSLYQDRWPDLVVTDLVMPNKEGIETIIELKKITPDVKIIAISGGGRSSPGTYLDLAKVMGAKQTFEKPLDWEALLAAIQRMVPV